MAFEPFCHDHERDHARHLLRKILELEFLLWLEFYSKSF